MGYPNIFPEDVITVGSASVRSTTAGTIIIVPSTATGSIYVTWIFISNGATAIQPIVGYGVGLTSPTNSAILINPLIVSNGLANTVSGFQAVLDTPLLVPASNNLLFSCTTNATAVSITATYYVAP